MLTLVNPLTYVSETMRGAIVPDGRHMSAAITVPVMIGATVLFVVLGMLGFRRRAID